MIIRAHIPHTYVSKCVFVGAWMFFFFAHYSTDPAVKPYENNTAYHFAPPLLPHRSAVSEMLTLVFHCTPFPSPLTHSCLKAKGDGGAYCLYGVCVCL